ncbi:MAG: carboxypeptidase-like regulatory domain-containing protein, partial [Flavobacteriales bacterium]|nr:carboxypeptidase-like regulatory domain-containing protein [Flavobacteriales bacterium]
MKFRLFISVFFCFFCFSYFAQKGQIIGKVIDEKSNSSILYVTVSLHNYLDTSLISGVITDEQGKFKIQDIVLNSSYLLKCSFIGYKTYFKRVDFENEKSINLGDIFISPSVELLKGLEVLADKPMVTYEIDKKVVNVEQMNTVTSQTAVQVLA